MKRILVPIDGSQRSLIALEHVKNSFSPKVFEIVVLMVCDSMGFSSKTREITETGVVKEMDAKLDVISQALNKYSVVTVSEVGKPGRVITEVAQKMNCEMIVITKSTKENLVDAIGSTASYVIRHARCNVLIVQDQVLNKPEEYRGLIYRKAEGTVILRGQLSLKQSECLLPSVAGDCIYHVEVTRGRIRFSHFSYNEETYSWDLPPADGQKQFIDIIEGSSVDIPVNAEGQSSKADRIIISNKNMKTEAVFSYKITRAQ